jgi:peptide/nickel transport system substrate-binding protein
MNMGTGPYEFTSFKPSTQTTYKANPSYWGTKPTYQTLEVDTVSDDSTRLTAVQSGAFNAIYDIPVSQLKLYQSIPGFTVSEPTNDDSVYKFNFDMTKPPFNDVHLRQAFIDAIDRKQIVDGTLGGHATLAPTLVPAEIMKTVADPAQVDSAYASLEKGLTFDLDAAKAEMAKSATPTGVTVDLLVTGSDPNLSLIAQTAAQDLAKVGIILNIKEVDDNTFYNAVYFQHTTDGVSLEDFSGTNPDPANVPNYALSSQFGLPKGGQGSNLSDFDDPNVDSLLAQSQKLATDDPQRGALVLQALQAAQANPPFLPLAFPELYAGAGGGLAVSNFTPFWWMTSWPDAIAAK